MVSYGWNCSRVKNISNYMAASWGSVDKFEYNFTICWNFRCCMFVFV